MSVLDRKLLRELRSSKLLLLAITSIIAVGVSCQVAMHSAYNNLHVARAKYYAQCQMADFWIDLKKAPNTELDLLAEIPGITEIRSRIRFYATVDLPGVVKPLNGMILSLPEEQKPVINAIVPKTGSYFTDRRSNEVIVNDAFAREHGLAPGDVVHLILNNRRQELFVVGTAISSEFVYLLAPGGIVPDPEHFGVFYLKRKYAEEVFDFEGAANEVVGLMAPALRDAPRELLDETERRLAPFGVFSTTALADQASNQFLSSEIDGLASFGILMPIIFLVVAALVLNVLMTRLTEQQRTVVGTLKALGYTHGQVFGHFIKYGMAVGVVGGVAGGVLGYFFAAGMTDIYRDFYEFPELTNRFYPSTVLVGMFFSVVCAIAGSVNGARNVVRLPPADAMRPKPPRRGGAIFLERFTWLWSRLTFATRMVLRSVVRNRVRTTAGAFAAAMGASLLVAGFMMAHASVHMINFQFEQIWRSDIDLALKDERGLDALLEARRLPSVDRAEPQLNVACVFRNGSRERRGGITGLAAGARLTVPRDQDGNPVALAPVGLTVGRKMAELLDVSPGDTLLVQPIRGLREEREVPVVSIIDSYLGLTVYADIEYLSSLVRESFVMTGLQLQTDPQPAARDALYRRVKQLPGVQAVNSRTDTIAKLKSTIQQNMWVFIGLLVVFSGIVFFGSILNASLINIAERRREVATFLVLGYTPWQIGGLFLSESMIVNLVGTVIGMPIGYLMAFGMSLAYDTELFRFPTVCPPSVLVWTLILAVVFGLIAHAFVQRAIHHMNWAEALQTKE